MFKKLVGDFDLMLGIFVVLGMDAAGCPLWNSAV